MSMPDQERSEAAELEARWRDLGRVLVQRAPEVMEHALALFELAAVSIADGQDRAVTAESSAT